MSFGADYYLSPRRHQHFETYSSTEINVMGEKFVRNLSLRRIKNDKRHAVKSP